MTKLYVPPVQSIAGGATSGTIAQSGVPSPSFSQVGTPNSHVTLGSGGTFTLDGDLGDTSQAINVRAAGGGYAIEAPVTIQGDGTGAASFRLGMNIAWPTQKQFVNKCYRASAWYQYSGSGSFTQDFGLLYPNVSTDVFRSELSPSGYGWDDGTYHIFNPSGAEIMIASSDMGHIYQNWTTSTDISSVDITYNGLNGIYLFCRGGMTNGSGNLAIVHTDHVTQWLAGNPWHPSFLAWHSGIGTQYWRFMDMIAGSHNMAQEWSHRSRIDKPLPCASFMGQVSQGYMVVPYELMIDLCNRTGLDAWFSIPVRASADYISQCAALWASGLTNPDVRVWVEYGNEIWNSADPWYQGRNWASYRHATKRYATYNSGAANFTKTAHGLSNGQKLQCFETPANRLAYANILQAGTSPQTSYYMRGADYAYAKVIDANTFEVYSDVGLTSKATATTGMVELCYVPITGTGAETADSNGNYGQAMKEIWNAFDAALGSSRVVHVMASWAVLPATTSARMADPTVAARTECVAIAPYFNGRWWAAKIDVASGTFTPTMWASASSTEMYVGVYASGSTPTTNQVKNGTGTGYVASCHSTSYTTDSTWSTGGGGLSALSVVNGTTYDVFVVWGNSTVGYWKNKITIAASATPSSQYLFDSNANMRRRLLANNESVRATIAAHAAASGGKRVVCYEMGLDYTPGNSCPSKVTQLVGDWYNSTECGDAVARAINMIASAGATYGGYFSDTGYNTGLSTPAIFSLANNYADTTTYRYTALTPKAGKFRPGSAPMAISDIAATAITSEPSYPYTVCTFPDASLAYGIHSNNDDGLFDVSGNTLRLIAGTGINWSAYNAPLTPVVWAEGARDTDTFTVSVNVGLTGAAALISLMSVTPDATRQGHITTLYNSLSSNGLLAKLDCLYIMAAHDAQAARLNWITFGSYNLTEVSSPTFTTDRGYQGNGTSSYLETAFNPSSGGSHQYSQDSATLGVWSRTDVNNSAQYDIGYGASSGAGVNCRSALANTLRGGVNVGSNSNYGSNTTSVGHYAIARTSSSLLTGYKDGSSVGTASTASVALANDTINVLRGAGASNYSARQIAAAYIGSGLSSTDMSNLHSALNTYLVAVGAV